MDGDAGGWLLRPPAENCTANVFCFPYSGAGASMFSRWPRRIGDVAVCPVQPPARENRRAEPHFGTFEELAASAVPLLAPHLDRPFVLFGHCTGALAAYEVARYLAAHGLPKPEGLVVSAQAAPHECPYDRLLDRTEDELATEIAEVLTAQGGVAHPVLVRLALDVLLRDLDASRAYRMAAPAPVPVPLTVVHWAAGAEITEEKVREWRHYADRWRLVVLPGGHHELLAGPSTLLDVLAAAARPAPMPG